MELRKQKIDYITFIQSLAVTLVVIGHSFPKEILTDSLPAWAACIRSLIYSFHMPLFFVLAGFLFVYSFEKKGLGSFKEFFIKKFNRLIIPYIAVGSVAYCLKTFIFNSFAYRPSTPSALFYLKSMLYPLSNPNIYLWFLPTIFIVFLIFYFLVGRKKYIVPIFVFSLMLSVLSDNISISFLNIQGVLYYIFYFVCGIMIFYYKNKLFDLFKNKFFILTTLSIYLSIYLSAISSDIVKIPLALCGIVLSFSMALICSDKNYKFLWGILDGWYYQIYLLSWFAQTGLRIFYQINLISYYTCVIIMILGAFLFSFLMIKIIANYFPRLKIFIGM